MEGRTDNTMLNIPFSEPVLADIYPLSHETMREAERRTAEELVELLFAESAETSIQIAHTPEGRPYIPALPHIPISLSHSGNLLALLVGSRDYIPGVDIERKGRNVERVRHKFINAREEKWLNRRNKQEQTELLSILWCAKEAGYKIFTPKDASLLRFTVYPVKFLSSTFQGVMAYEPHPEDSGYPQIQQLKFSVKILPKHYLVWALRSADK
ncbi:4'-phosphopantetheinyl transferase superfamily [Porphyromonas macacae]|uniref:4'-phosphopantetheinyl transferase superfamily n=2 Tax=Porphyromonas macacae TaxID=28115 RepID=A0A379E928_9PORP|nr:4'-phosphopantetheinyl transferase superfamily protein [Porphyromonas macacae]SUB88882.1 4'-phosphopantetheinyl transferase superfamily [Porphyromonas macacae]